MKFHFLGDFLINLININFQTKEKILLIFGDISSIYLYFDKF